MPAATTTTIAGSAIEIVTAPHLPPAPQRDPEPEAEPAPEPEPKAPSVPSGTCSEVGINDFPVPPGDPRDRDGDGIACES